MPAADDPLSRLWGRVAFDDALKQFWGAQSPPKLVRSWPRLDGEKHLDLYVLFETVRAFGGLHTVANRRYFEAISDLMILPTSSTGLSTMLRRKYCRFCKPFEQNLEAILEAAYISGGRYESTHNWITARTGIDSTGDYAYQANTVRNYGLNFAETRAVDPESREEKAFLRLPEATQAVIRARLRVSWLEMSELVHPLFQSKHPNMVLLDIRNHIIRMWYRDTRSRLEIRAVLVDLPSRFHSLTIRTFVYLGCSGVINFGAIPPAPTVPSLVNVPICRRKRIAIIGAGISGLIAGRQLKSYGVDITILEARERAGGRVYTESTKLSTGVDMGAMIITGVIQNPVAVIAHQTNSPMHFMDARCPLFDIDGRWVSPEADAWAEREFNAVMDAAGRYRMRHGLEDKVRTLSLGRTFQSALEKRVSRRKYLVEQVLSGADKTTLRKKSEGWVLEYEEFSETFSSESCRTRDNRTQQEPSGLSPLRNVVRRQLQNSDQESPADCKSEHTNHSKSSSPDDGLRTLSKLPCSDVSGPLTRPTKRVRTTDNRLELDEKQISRLLRWHIANLEYACAADIDSVSLLHWDQDDPYGFSGEHVLLKEGFSSLVEGLVCGVEENINFSAKVSKVEHSTENGMACVHVETPEGEVCRHDYDAVLVTIPLGVLKDNGIDFEPPLPKSKRDAIDRLGCGGLMKVAMEFEYQFWIKSDMFGALREDVAKRGEFFFFWNLVPCTGKPVLVALVAEPTVSTMENRADDELVAEAMCILRRCFPSAPNPKSYSVSRWTKDRFSRGAYTNIPVGSTGADYDVIADPVGDSLYFAGEHTCRRNPTTCASAVISGLREAQRLVEKFCSLEDMAAELSKIYLD